MLQQKLLKYLLSVLNDSGIDYMMTGSIVSSLQGEPRATHDIDLVVQIPLSAILPLKQAFSSPDYYLSETSVREAIQHKSMFNVLDIKGGDKIDFWILTNEPFDVSRFERKYEIDVFGFKIKISRPEDTILAKLRWAKLSGGSEKQFTDALRVYEVQYGVLNFDYLQDWVTKLEVQELWQELRKRATPL